MGLYYGDLYWERTFDKKKQYPSLSGDIKCDVIVVGGGMSGTLVANELINRGVDTVLIDQNQVAKGSSMANTGMLQYSSDKMMWKFAKDIGERDAALFYEMCHKSMLDLNHIHNKIPGETNFHFRPSIYYASDNRGKKDLKKEYKILKKYGFPVEEMGKRDLKQSFNMDKDYALITRDDAEINPYQFVNLLTEYLTTKGLRVYENTEIEEYEGNNLEAKIKTKKGTIRTHYIVLATGYAERYILLKDQPQINMTYAIATQPLLEYPWKERAMIWETASPYLYFRANEENRIIGGGLDKTTSNISNSKYHIYKKADKILKDIKKIFPKLETEVEFAWNAQFGESQDGLPFIGADPVIKNLFYCLGFGGNGTAYSMAGGGIIADLIENKKNKYAHIVKLDR